MAQGERRGFGLVFFDISRFWARYVTYGARRRGAVGLLASNLRNFAILSPRWAAKIAKD
ncbi:hypothetical protein IMCC12053_2130 [Celeribacter marinus]|uniref:Uncharacterized protein n=1 Tax=Celeribacter marinus TaxID=1397108 RepID=A0A0N7HIT0_9RHOB|nr:hypothetical protein IMCC12053_2130 [Celeribacter marinus]